MHSDWLETENTWNYPVNYAGYTEIYAETFEMRNLLRSNCVIYSGFPPSYCSLRQKAVSGGQRCKKIVNLNYRGLTMSKLTPSDVIKTLPYNLRKKLKILSSDPHSHKHFSDLFQHNLSIFEGPDTISIEKKSFKIATRKTR